jgi:hypothetical protein
MNTLPDNLLATCLQLSIKGCAETWRIRNYMRLQLVCTRFRRLVTQESPDVWHTVILPMYGAEKLTHAMGFLACRIPRNTIVSFTCMTRLPYNATFLRFLKAHAGSLDYIGLYDVDMLSAQTSVFNEPRCRPVFQGLSVLKTVSLTSRGHRHPPLMTLPPLPSLEKVILDIKHADVSLASDLIGPQPSLQSLVIYSWQKDRRTPIVGRNVCIMPWIRQLTSLCALEITMKYGDAQKLLENPDLAVLSTITKLKLTMYEPPSSYAFLRSFSHAVYATIKIDTGRNENDALEGVVFQHWVHVKELSLKHVRVGRAAQFLSEMSQMTKLQLRGCTVRTLEGLSKNTNLESLSIYDQELHDCAGLSALQQLQTLGLWAPNLTDASELGTLRQLRHLGLVECRHVRGVPWHCPHFTQNLESVRIFSGVCEDMTGKAHVPKLQVVELEGGNMDGVGKFLESVGTTQLQRVKWGGILTPGFVKRYPNATAILEEDYRRRKQLLGLLVSYT